GAEHSGAAGGAAESPAEEQRRRVLAPGHEGEIAVAGPGDQDAGATGLVAEPLSDTCCHLLRTPCWWDLHLHTPAAAPEPPTRTPLRSSSSRTIGRRTLPSGLRGISSTMAITSG